MYSGRFGNFSHDAYRKVVITQACDEKIFINPKDRPVDGRVLSEQNIVDHRWGGRGGVYRENVTKTTLN